MDTDQRGSFRQQAVQQNLFFVRTLPGIIPVLNLEANKNAHYNNDEINADGEPVLVLYILRDPA